MLNVGSPRVRVRVPTVLILRGLLPSSDRCEADGQSHSVRWPDRANKCLISLPDSATITAVRHRRMILHGQRRTVRYGSPAPSREACPCSKHHEPAPPGETRRLKRPAMAIHKASKVNAKEKVPGEPKGWRPLDNPIPRFLAKVKRLDSGCWQWTAAMHRHGYGAFGVGSDLQGYAHRWSYIFFVGNIPAGYVVDHLCANRACVNPDHLEAVSQRTNSMRGAGPALTRARYESRTECSRGHPFDEENTYRHPNGRRVCRTCFREYDRLWARARRAGMPTKRPSASQVQPDTASQGRRKSRRGDPKERLLSKIEIAASGCWVWTAARFPTGYGKFQVGRSGGDRLAHRWAYRLFVSPIPEATEIDHLCRNRACVNPQHLEPVTHSENSRRAGVGRLTGARQKAKTHCPHGHPYDDENTYRNPQGERACRTCQRLHARAHYWRKKSTGDPQP